MKKLINDKNNIIDEMITGMVLANPDVERVANYNAIVRKNRTAKKVILISGGGSGHEPAHAGYVGKNMLDGAVLGPIFTSPSPDQIMACVNAFEQKEFLFIVKNYTGDKLNFEIAKELAEAEGKKVAILLVADDVAVENSTWTIGRRGIAGTIFCHKILGKLAETKASLEKLISVGEKITSNLRSFGIAINSIYNPMTGKKTFELDDNSIEFGLGIHGEPGVEKSEMLSARKIVKKMLDVIFKDFSYKNSEVALMINGLGGTPKMELMIVNNDVHHFLKQENITVYKNFVGNFMTSLEMQGFSISLLKLDDELKQLLD